MNPKPSTMWRWEGLSLMRGPTRPALPKTIGTGTVSLVREAFAPMVRRTTRQRQNAIEALIEAGARFRHMARKWPSFKARSMGATGTELLTPSCFRREHVGARLTVDHPTDHLDQACLEGASFRDGRNVVVPRIERRKTLLLEHGPGSVRIRPLQVTASGRQPIHAGRSTLADLPSVA